MQNQDKAQAEPDVESPGMSEITKLRADFEARVAKIQSSLDKQHVVLCEIDKTLDKTKEILQGIQQSRQDRAKLWLEAQPQTQPQQSQQLLPSASECSMADPGNQPEEELRDHPSTSGSISIFTPRNSAVTPARVENAGEQWRPTEKQFNPE